MPVELADHFGKLPETAVELGEMPARLGPQIPERAKQCKTFTRLPIFVSCNLLCHNCRYKNLYRQLLYPVLNSLQMALQL